MLVRTSSWCDSIGECTRMRSACARPSSNSWLCAVERRFQFHLKEWYKRDVYVRDSYMIHVHRHPTPLTHRRINRKVNFCWRLDLDHSVALMQAENGWLYTCTHNCGAAVAATQQPFTWHWASLLRKQECVTPHTIETSIQTRRLQLPKFSCCRHNRVTVCNFNPNCRPSRFRCLTGN